MALECKAWRASSDNTLHNTASAACAHDLKNLCVTLSDRSSGQGDLEEAMIAHADTVISVLTEYRKHTPAAPGISKGSDSSDGKKGPVKRDPRTLAEIRATRSHDKFLGHDASCKARALNQLPLCDCTMSKISFSKPVPMYDDLEQTT